MSATFFTADLHFGHVRVANLRGYETPDEHDYALFHEWERVIRGRDRVYVLGDISCGKEDWALTLLSQLPGEKHLIAGNHDSVASLHRNGWRQFDRYREVFESVRDFARLRVQKKDLLLSHYPYSETGDGENREGVRYLQYRLPNLGTPLVHGHTHQNHPDTSRTEYCVSWDAHGTLVPLHTIERYFHG